MAKEEKSGNETNKKIVSLDIGSSKIGVFIGEILENGKVRILGFGNPVMKKGDDNELEATVNALKKAVVDAELSSGVDVKELYVGIAGSSVRSLVSRARIPLRDFEGVVTKEAMNRVVEQTSQMVQYPADLDIIHVLPGDYSIDDREGIKNPLGMEGASLSVETLLVMAPRGIIRTIHKAVESAGLVVKGLVLEQLADACCVLYKDEKELGVAIVAIGATSTDIAVFKDDKVVYTSSFNEAGNSITNDIAYGLTTPIESAEEIKKEHGTCFRSNLLDDSKFTVPGIGGRSGKECSTKHLAYIIYCQIYNILMKVRADLEAQNFLNKKKKTENENPEEKGVFDGKDDVVKNLGAGIVITGGTAQLKGILELAEQIFDDVEVRLGAPQKNESGFSEILSMPLYSTGVGLLNYAAQNEQPRGKRETQTTKIVSAIGSKWKRFSSWIGQYI